MLDGCSFCVGSKPLVDDGVKGIVIQEPNHLMAYGYLVDHRGNDAVVIHVNYCPMCGRKMEGYV